MLRPLQLPTKYSGKFWLSAMPGRFEQLEEFFGWCQTDRVEEVVCLVSNEEIEEISPDYRFASEAKRLPFSFTQFPVPDYDVPANAQGLIDLSRQIEGILRHGRRIVVHCAAGHGRTGLFVTLILLAAGLTLEYALAVVRAAGSNPETESQNAFLKDVEREKGEASRGGA